MTRKEWMKQHYPNVVQDHFIGGVQSCPSDYSMLMLVDKSISRDKSIFRMNRCLRDCEEFNMREACTKCWNHEIEEVTL